MAALIGYLLTEELDTYVSVITETWLNSSVYLGQVNEDFQSMNGCELIRKDRNTGRKRGGVAIWFNDHSIAMSRARLTHSRHDIVAAIGRRTGQ